jgi:hypothetical protein
MRLAVFCRWPSRDVGPGSQDLGEPGSEQIVAEETDGRSVLGVYFRNASGNSRDAAGVVATTSAAETFVGVEIGDTGPSEPGSHVFLVTFRVPREDQGEFDSWYETEHVARLMEVPGWLRCRRYAVADEGTSPTRVALHELASLAALDSPLRAAAAASEWRRQLAARPWFATGRFDTFTRVPALQLARAGSGSPAHQ